MTDYDNTYDMLKHQRSNIELTTYGDNKIIRLDDYDHFVEFTFDKDGKFLYIFVINNHD